jgi:hypothetical protein
VIEITRNSFTCCFGMTRTGKSLLARGIFMAQPGPKVAIDVKDEMQKPDENRLPGVPTVTDPAQILDYPTCRAVPPDPSDEAWYDELYLHAFNNPPYLVWLDEGNEPTSSSFIPRKMRTFILQGMGRGSGHIMCTPRPADVHKTFESQVHHVFVFELQHERDRAAIARITGLPSAHIDERLDYIAQFRVSASEPSHHFLYFSPGMREFRTFDPIEDPEVLTAQIARRSFHSWRDGGYVSPTA